ncbi:MAG: hypothetical protein ACPIOQ_46840, partial [Promethearchaeia archaeon]
PRVTQVLVFSLVRKSVLTGPVHIPRQEKVIELYNKVWDENLVTSAEEREVTRAQPEKNPA